jgi:hypothetical protein
MEHAESRATIWTFHDIQNWARDLEVEMKVTELDGGGRHFQFKTGTGESLVLWGEAQAVLWLQAFEMGIQRGRMIERRLA